MRKSIQYAKDVVSGKQIAGKQIIKAAERFLSDLKRKDLYFDVNELEKIYQTIEKDFYVPELGRPNDVPRPHAFWIDQFYGLKYKRTKKRKYKTLYLQVARKNFKTFFAGVLSLIELLIYHDKMPEILVGANSRDQALITTEKIGNIIKVSPKLKDLERMRTLHRFTDKQETTGVHYEDDTRNGKIVAIPRDLGDGGNPSLFIIDEYHEAKTTKLLETGRSGQSVRANPASMILTSPGNNKDLPWYEERLDSIKVLDGDVHNDRHLAMIFELDDITEYEEVRNRVKELTADYLQKKIKFDEYQSLCIDAIAVLEKSNPMMPYSENTVENLIDRIKLAIEKGGSVEANIIIKNCGISIDAPEIWIDSGVVQENNFEIDENELKKVPVFVGFDLAKGKDLNALAIMGEVEEKMAVKMHYWIPSEKFNLDEGFNYRKYREYFYIHEGSVIDHLQMGNEILAILEEYNVQVIGYDSKYANMGVVPILYNNNYSNNLVPVGQGFNLSPATLQIEQWIMQKQMNLLNNPVLLWNFRNVTLNTGSKGDVYPDKMRSTGKIDGVLAMCNSVTEYLRLKAEPKKELYIGGL